MAASRSDWSQLQAYAWSQTSNLEVLNGLRKDPKGSILALAEGTSPKFPNIDSGTKQAAINIKTQAEVSPGENYSGFLPIPSPTGGLANLDLKDLTALIRNGLTGILRFDQKAELWADIFHQAWNDGELLRNIRKDPLQYLPHKDKLLADEYGIFPLTDLPKGLEQLSITNLENFLNDEDNVLHLSGIFLIGS